MFHWFCFHWFWLLYWELIRFVHRPPYSYAASLPQTRLVGLVVQPVYIGYELKPAQCSEHVNEYRLWCFSLYNDGHKRGSVFGSLLSHAISKFDDWKTCFAFHHLLFGLCASSFHACVFWKTFLQFLLLPALLFAFAFLLFLTLEFIKLFSRQHQLQMHDQQQIVQSSNADQHNLDIQRSKKSATNSFIYYICMTGP